MNLEVGKIYAKKNASVIAEAVRLDTQSMPNKAIVWCKILIDRGGTHGGGGEDYWFLNGRYEESEAGQHDLVKELVP